MNFENLRNSYIALIKPIDYLKINLQNSVTINSPLRVNLSAGWNDTPPYCNEVSGYTLNAPILLNNKFPIEVRIHKIAENKILFKNLDSNASISVNNMNELLDCQTPNAPFSLHKASVLASGLLPYDIHFNLNLFFKKFGGFEMITSVKGIPIGSGLGTSSILLHSCIKAIYRFCNLQTSEIDLFHMTACAEQIMTTGGGYQDQIGAYCKDFKFITFHPGIYPEITCENLQLNTVLKNELQDRLAYVYTGNTRVAKDLLQKIMGSYIRKNPNTIKTLHEIGIVAKNMKGNLLSSDLVSFAKNMAKSFDLNVQLNPSFTNENIQNLLHCLKDLIDGYMLSGAGNGGFMTIILKDGVSKKKLNDFINLNFKNSKIRLYDFQLYF